MGFNFDLIKTDTNSRARLGKITTSHGIVNTPAFMPVGTKGAVKTMTALELSEIGVEMILCNTYHLHLRPGDDLIKEMGGLHNFIAWDRPILTDSGGYQVFSMCSLRKIDEGGVHFQSHLDGTKIFLTPEKAVEIQEALGADIIMCLDICTPASSGRDDTHRDMELTHKWEKRCSQARGDDANQALFGIVQGGMYADLRRESAEEIVEIGFDGYAIGGLSVGEDKADMRDMIDATIPALPAESPRYLMGVGTPEDIVDAVLRGIDMFDCVMPTRNARNGTLFTNKGKLVIKNARFAKDQRPIDEDCECYTCCNYTRAYLRHLYIAGEMLALRLNTLHNLYHYMELMRGIREAIHIDRYTEFRNEFYNRRQ